MALGIVENSFNRLDSTHGQIASDVLRTRSQILPPINAKFVEASNVVIDLFNHNRICQKGGTNNDHELPDGKTRLVYLGMMISLQRYRHLWPHLPIENPEALQVNDDFKFFRLVLNKYKVLKSGKYELKTRLGKMDGLPVAYATHTHADLENFMISYFSNSPNEAFSLAVGHDLNEEGLRVSPVGGSGEVDPKYLTNKFPNNKLGLKLAIGIPTLTETKKDGLKACIQKSTMDAYRKSGPVVDLQREFFALCPDSKGKITSAIYHSPMEYGGLALQIKRVIEKLKAMSDSSDTKSHLTADEMKLLAKCMIEVELTDRMSEMAELERFIINKSNSPRFARIKTLLNSCKMLNMFEKLSGSIELLGDEEYFQPALNGYLATLKVKLTEVNRMLDTLGEQPVSDDELVKFYYSRFKPVQEQADLALSGFIEAKTDLILEPLLVQRSQLTT